MKKDKRISVQVIIDQASTDVKFTVDLPSPVAQAFDDFLPASSSTCDINPNIPLHEPPVAEDIDVSFPISSLSSSIDQNIPLDEAPVKKKARCSEEFTASFSKSYKQFDKLSERQRREKT